MAAAMMSCDEVRACRQKCRPMIAMLAERAHAQEKKDARPKAERKLARAAIAIARKCAATRNGKLCRRRVTATEAAAYLHPIGANERAQNLTTRSDDDADYR